MIELIAAALLQLAVITTDGSAVLTADAAATEASVSAQAAKPGDGGAGNWDDGN